MGYHFRGQDSFVCIVELTPAMRQQIENTIEHLLSVLDHFDGDENIEDDGSDEPWLGWPDGHHVDCIRNPVGEDDLEEDCSDDEDGGDYEPDDNGIADHDALHDVANTLCSFGFDGSGHKLANTLQREAGI